MLGSLFRFAGGILVGAAAGAVAAALLAPKSGDQLKSDAQSYWDQIKQAGAEAEAQRRAELESRFKKAKLNQPVELDIDFYPREMRVQSKVKTGQDAAASGDGTGS